ncbi:hypothetical protein CDAR_486311 [Caerostris darwini]|uniref:Uncharacterized protein n=1 Tax=Caerostris darwini TaxID=1538125 RepID=A0AAV4MAK4_9ARAC|nr:hypothetical protein CDAR_486311 [Caerostris darwini]
MKHTKQQIRKRVRTAEFIVSIKHIFSQMVYSTIKCISQQMRTWKLSKNRNGEKPQLTAETDSFEILKGNFGRKPGNETLKQLFKNPEEQWHAKPTC